MLKLFKSMNIGNMKVKNRFVRSATCEGMATERGEITNELIKMYKKLAKGEIGLIILGYMYIHPFGRAFKHQTGIYCDDLIPGIKAIVNAIHEQDGKIAIQIVHAGPQTYPHLIGTTPLAPSKRIMNPSTFAKPKEMNEEEIQETIQLFADAARRAVKAGVDAIQLHAAHGYLINQFLSPYFNLRQDEWGGSDENRFRYLKEILSRVKKAVPHDIPILIKLNTNDYTQEEGITPRLAVKYAEWLVELGIDAIEISCGTAHFSTFKVSQGDVPAKEIVQWLPNGVREMAEKMFQGMVGKYNLKEGYNLEAAKMLKPKIGDVPLILVGGLRTVSFMEKILENNYADFVSLSRPFIREPHLAKQIKKGRKDGSSCVSCNRCLAALVNDFPVRCYVNKFPERI